MPICSFIFCAYAERCSSRGIFFFVVKDTFDVVVFDREEGTNFSTSDNSCSAICIENISIETDSNLFTIISAVIFIKINF